MTKKTPEKYLMLAGASAIALSMLAPVATAQDDGGGDVEVRRTLGTVLVTTQKTEESIQDVPIAASSSNAETAIGTS